MTDRTFEAQFDVGRKTVTLATFSNHGRYAVVVPAASQAEADEKLRQFKTLYDLEGEAT